MKRINFQDLLLYEDSDFIVINKPPHYSTLDDRHPEGKKSMLDLAREYWSEAQMAHRLDRDTSGALAIAKTPEAYRHLSMQFEHRSVHKVYHALVNGIVQLENTLVDKPILPLGHGIVKIDFQKGKEAQTYFDTQEVYRQHTLLACRPITGRMHQIRIHLAVLGHPIVGDVQYGGEQLYLSELKKNFNLKRGTEELPLIQRFALHAFKLEFKTLEEQALQVEAPYPKDFRALVRQLEKNP